MTLLEKPKVVGVPETPAPPRLQWTIWVVLAVLIVAGVTAAILLTTDGTVVPSDEVVANLAINNYATAHRITALNQAAGNDLALELTSFRVTEEMFPGRLEMLETSVLRADRALRYSIDRVAGG